MTRRPEEVQNHQRGRVSNRITGICFGILLVVLGGWIYVAPSITTPLPNVAESQLKQVGIGFRDGRNDMTMTALMAANTNKVASAVQPPHP